jgi:hypothetical protein
MKQKRDGENTCNEAYEICRAMGYNRAWEYARDNGVRWPSYGGLP